MFLISLLHALHWIHTFFLSLSPRKVDRGIAGLEEAKNLAGKLLRLIQIGLTMPSLEKFRLLVYRTLVC